MITWTKSLLETEEMCRYVDDETGEEGESPLMELTLTPNNSDLTIKTFSIRKNRKGFDDEIYHFEWVALNDWMTELGLNHETYYADHETLLVKEKGKIEDQTQIQNWLKPNGIQAVEPKDAETI
tara:strand:- start:4195 stop:4566 length:372 start_codon:yes stop_codon:yes gene_type:complete